MPSDQQTDRTLQDGESLACQFKTDQEDAIGTSGEIVHGKGGVYCTADADDVLRPKGGWHIREYGKRATFCHSHAAYLVEDAVADWEMISHGDLSRLRNLPEDTGAVYVVEDSRSYHESQDCPSTSETCEIPRYYAKEHWEPCSVCAGESDAE